ncbi:hypothetical protein EI555_011059, partial [Monodon monoceros]
FTEGISEESSKEPHCNKDSADSYPCKCTHCFFGHHWKMKRESCFHSQAYSRASEVGEVDLEHASSLGGDYVGVHPMGLLWSLKPEKILTKLLKRDVMNNPLQVQLKLYDSDVMVTPHRHHYSKGQPDFGEVVCSTWCHPNSREGRFPVVIDLFGGIGGLIEIRASLLASHGFAVLALAYCDYEDLPF